MSSSSYPPPKPEPIRVVPKEFDRSEYRAAVRKLKKMQKAQKKARDTTGAP